jgi:DNA-binding response OmpR family regulator
MTMAQKNILVVDDQYNWRNMLETILLQEGYGVQTADNFESAQNKILASPFDLIILDLRLVDEDVINVQGLELLKSAKLEHYHPTVIILTGYPESMREGILDELKADALMYKVPLGGRFNVQEFKKNVRGLLKISYNES